MSPKKRSGWDPTRSNKNIGTAKQGRGRDNRLVIPEKWSNDRAYWEKLEHPVRIQREIGDLSLTFLVEPPLKGFVHACTVDDLAYMLKLIPITDLQGLQYIIFNQPKRKAYLLEPVWGRLGYWVGKGKHSGPGIFLEAQCPSEPLKWNKSLTPDQVRELKRLRKDGHKITRGKRHHVITQTIDSIRSTQLYRTLLHEIGHFVDPLPERPQREREDFAHQYSDNLRRNLISKNLIPFPRILDIDRISSDGLRIEWFTEG